MLINKIHNIFYLSVLIPVPGVELSIVKYKIK